MGLLDFLFKEKKQELQTNQSPISEFETTSDKYVSIEPYIETTVEKIKLVSIIATSIASGDSPESQFVVKKVLKRNPEAKKIALITASVAATESKDSILIATSIKKRKED